MTPIPTSYVPAPTLRTLFEPKELAAIWKTGALAWDGLNPIRHLDTRGLEALLTASTVFGRDTSDYLWSALVAGHIIAFSALRLASEGKGLPLTADELARYDPRPGRVERRGQQEELDAARELAEVLATHHLPEEVTAACAAFRSRVRRLWGIAAEPDVSWTMEEIPDLASWIEPQ